MMGNPARPGRILVIEDSRTMALALQMTLTQAGYEVVVALHGADGLDRVQNSDFDLVLCDVQMPVLDGYGFCAAVRADPRTRRLPLLLLTSLSDPHDFMAGLSCGATGYITKPYEPANLLARVEGTLERASQSRRQGDQSPRQSQFLGRNYSLPDDPELVTTYLLSTFEEFTLTRQREHDSRLAEQRRRFELDGARRAERFLQSTLDALSAAIAVIGLDGQVVAVNQGWSAFASAGVYAPFGVGGNYLTYAAQAAREGLAFTREIAGGVRDVLDGRQLWFHTNLTAGEQPADRHFTLTARRFAVDGTVWAVVGHEETTEQHRAEAALRRHAGLQHLIATHTAAFVDIEPDQVESRIQDAFLAVATFCGADRALLQEWTLDQPTPTFLRWGRASPDGPLHPLPAGGPPDQPWLLAQTKARGSMRMNRVDLPPEAETDRRTATELGLQSVVMVAFGRQGQAEGLIMLGSARTGAWSEDDVDMLRLLANVFDNAIARRASRRVIEAAELQVRESQKMDAVGRLAGGIAHDFNNLLTVVHVCATNTLGLLGESEPLRAEIDEIIKASRRATALVKQLLAFSRRQVVAPTVEDVDFIVTDVEQMLRRLLGTSIQFDLDLRASPAMTLVDRHQLEQVVVNLVVNARDSMPGGGVLRLSTEVRRVVEPFAPDAGNVPTGAYLVIAVEDNGHGMDATVQARVFEPFFTTKEIGRGTGLGLSTSYGIVRQAGGHISIDSAVGKGTTIRVWLPECPEPSPATIAQPAADVSGPMTGTETVLVVDDDAAVRGQIARALEAKGYRVWVAVDGQDGLDVCRRVSAPIDLLLTDRRMPRMDGTTLVRTVRETWPMMKVLMVSGFDPDAADSGQAENIPFLAKPFDVDHLAATVRRVLDGL